MSEEQKEVVSIEEHSKVQQELQRITERAQRFEGKFTDLEKQFEKFQGVNLDELRANNEAYQRLQKEKATGSASEQDFEAVWKDRETSLITQNQQKLEELNSELQKKSSMIHEMTVVDKAMGELASRFRSDTHEFVKDIVRKSCDIDETGQIFIKGADGKAQYINGGSQRLSVEEFGKQLTEKYPSFAVDNSIAGTRGSGETKNGHTSSGARSLPNDFNTYSQEQKVQFFTENPGVVPPMLKF